MLNLSSVDSGSVAGRIIRLPLRLIPGRAVVRIVQGPCRGFFWVVGSGTHGMWVGCYEQLKQRRVLNYLKPGTVVYDIGANVGFYTLLFSRIVGDGGHVFAFEPLPENVSHLTEHVGINRCTNVFIQPAAVGSITGTVCFEAGMNRFIGRVVSDSTLTVSSLTLDDFVFKLNNPPPRLMKIDVEGGEFEVLKGARRLIIEACPTIFLATHGREIHNQCCKLLGSLGYRFEGLRGESADSTDELICLSPTA